VRRAISPEGVRGRAVRLESSLQRAFNIKVVCGVQIAASSEVQVVGLEDVSADLLAKEREIELQKEDLASKPEAIRCALGLAPPGGNAFHVHPSQLYGLHLVSQCPARLSMRTIAVRWSPLMAETLDKRSMRGSQSV